MDANTITVYRGPDSLRVVRGEHKVAGNAGASRVTVYPDIAAALAIERHADVLEALARFEPAARVWRVRVTAPDGRHATYAVTAPDERGAIRVANRRHRDATGAVHPLTFSAEVQS